MNNSPDRFYSVRYNNATVAAAKPEVQLMEFKAHNTTVNEYGDEVLSHLLAIQHRTLPNLALIQQQPEINLKMRPLLLDFLMDVINKLQLSKSTFPLCVNLIDRYCLTRIVKKQHYQLLGLTSLWISCKNSDSKIKIPTLNELCKMCCNCYDKKLFLEMENHLLKSLNWLISFPTFDSYIDIFCKEYATLEIFMELGFSLKQVKYLAIYICELIQFYPNIYFNYNLCEISLTAFMLSLMILNFKVSPMADINKLNAKQQRQQQQQGNTLACATPLVSGKIFSAISSSLMVVLKCPPPSLKLKYFSKTNNKNLHLMQLVLKFCNANSTPNLLSPITPKNSIHKSNQLPPTPLSSNISPSDQAPFLPSPRLSPHNNNPAFFQNNKPFTKALFNSSPPFTPLDSRAGQVMDGPRVFLPLHEAESQLRSMDTNDYTTAAIMMDDMRVFGPHPVDTDDTTAPNMSNGRYSSFTVQNPVFPPEPTSDSLNVMKLSSSAPSLKKRSYQILDIHNTAKIPSEQNDENLKRAKSVKPVFYIS